jgi:hypothetical protein
MATTTLEGSRQRRRPSPPRRGTRRAAAGSPARRAAYLLSAVVAGLMVVASTGGLLIDGLYRDDSHWATAALRGGDLATLAVAVPLLLVALRFVATGTLPGDVPAAGQHLVYALDLSLLAPSLAVAAILLWRRTAWGYLLGTAISTMGAVYQVNLMLAAAFQANAHVAGVSAFSPPGLLLTVAFAAAAALLLANLRPPQPRP